LIESASAFKPAKSFSSIGLRTNSGCIARQ
jgi:hypothetical protein